MYRRILVPHIITVGAILHLVVGAGAQPMPGENPNPNVGREIYLIVKARVYEVDEAFYVKLAKAKWRSKAELEELESRPPVDGPLFAQLAKQKPFLVGREINLDSGNQGVLLTAIKPINCSPTPNQLQQGKKVPQTIDEGFTLSAQVHISADRRFVRARFLEKSLEIEGIEKIKVIVDDKGTEAVGEVVSVKEASVSHTRYVPDAGSILVPLQYRPRAVREKERWLVVEITPRILIEEEERVRRGEAPN